MPGIETTLVITPNRTGQFAVMCTELCGLGHATMRRHVRVVSRATYDKFLADASAGASDESRRRRVFTTAGCGGCHTFTPAGTDARSGRASTRSSRRPGSRSRSSSTSRSSTRMPCVAAGYQPDVMPKTFEQTLSDEQLDALVQYLVDGQKGSK